MGLVLKSTGRTSRELIKKEGRWKRGVDFCFSSARQTAAWARLVGRQRAHAVNIRGPLRYPKRLRMVSSPPVICARHVGLLLSKSACCSALRSQPILRSPAPALARRRCTPRRAESYNIECTYPAMFSPPECIAAALRTSPAPVLLRSWLCPCTAETRYYCSAARCVLLPTPEPGPSRSW